MGYREEYDSCLELFMQHLDGYFTDKLPQSELLESMRYSLFAGGKRIRPILLLKFCEAAGGDMNSALPYAAAIEMIHTYSLIHDDLPCMDNDDLRRGRPTNHVVYGECTAILAGDALQAEAFYQIASAPNSGDINSAVLRELSRAAGAYGMCGGQYIDMAGEKRQLEISEIENLQLLKTGALISAACVMGTLAAGKSSESEAVAAAREFGIELARAFQIRDDILDITSTTQALGKPVGSDKESNKSSFAAVLGVEKCEELVRTHTENAKKALKGHFDSIEFFETLADSLAQREY